MERARPEPDSLAAGGSAALRCATTAAGSRHPWRFVERALEWTRKSLALNPDDASAIFNGSCLMARLGRRDGALEVLTLAFDRGWGQRDWLERDPDYDSLRDDSRFQALLAKLK